MYRFLQRFNYDVITVVLLHPKKPSQTITLKLKEYPDVRRNHFLPLNKTRGYEVFFMVNEGDGFTIPDGRKTVRNQEAVINYKALFIDTDTCPKHKVDEFLDLYDLRPHIIIESSPEKYHYYFLLTTTIKTVANKAKWRACQRALAYLGDVEMTENGCDVSMVDDARLLRVPDFDHLKDSKKPFTTKLIRNNTHERYDIDTLFNVLKAHRFYKNKKKVYNLPKSRITAGDRHNSMVSFVGNLIHNNVSAEIVLEATYGFIQRRFKEADLFLPEGERNHEVLDAIQYAENTQAEVALDQQVFLLKDRAKEEDYSLPDDFFLNTPGIAGEMIREINKTAFYKAPPMTFATVVALLGSLKCHRISPTGLTSSNYFLCIGESGSGKDYAQKVLSATFSELNIISMLSNKMRSAQGFYKTLKRTGGRTLLMMDEGKTFFQSLSEGQKSSTWRKECMDLLLQLYTSCNSAHFDTGDLAEKNRMTFKYPCLNMISFSTPSSLNQCFNVDSIEQGFISRCFIVTQKNKLRQRNVYAQAPTSLPPKLSHEIAILHTEMKNYFGEMTDDLGKPLKTVFYEDGVKEIIDKYTDKLDIRYNSLSLANEHAYKPLFTRGREQVIRLCMALADDLITKDIVRFCIQFVDSRIEATYRHFKDQTNVSSNSLSGNMSYFLDFVTSHLMETGNPVTYRDIYKNTKFRTKKQADEVIQACREASLIKVAKDTSKKGKPIRGFVLSSYR